VLWQEKAIGLASAHSRWIPGIEGRPSFFFFLLTSCRCYFLGWEVLKTEEATRYLPSSPFKGSRSSEKFEAPPEAPYSAMRARK
jgi:hypothetical protein